MNKSLILALFIFLSCSAEKKIFDLKSIDQDPLSNILSLNAHSVIRDSEMLVEVINPSEAYLTIKKATTIFEKDNKDAGRLVIFYSPLQQVDYIKANIVNKYGEIVNSFSESDAEDFSAYDGFSFFSDNRVKVLDLNYSSFPYTVEVEYKMKFNATLFLPTWYPQSPGQSVQKASLKVIDHTKGVRFYSKNIKSEPVIADTLGAKHMTWEVGFLTAKEREDFGPPVQELLPSIALAPSKFEIENTQGDASNWQDFGKWYYSLGEGTRELNDEAILEVENVVRGLSSEKEIIEALYKYMQDKTRYVSIQLGIGGWKPFSAEYVFRNEYGDCKALTNYMQAILEHLGIKANPVLIRRGISEPSMIAEFSSNQFNHVLLRVELENGDIMWLECTSKYFAPGHIGSGNENKDALLVSEEGGKLIRTPKSLASENVSISTSLIEVSSTGEVIINTKRENRGVLQENLQYSLLPISEAARVEWLEKRITSGNFKIIKANFDGIESSNSSASYSYVLDFKNYTSTSATRIFVPLETINSWSFNPDEDKDRKQEIRLPYVFTEKDSSVYILPDGYEIEAVPEELTIDNEFAHYRIDYRMNKEGNLILKRELVINKDRLPAEYYGSFREFFSEVSKADNAQLVLVKKS
ncbi:MAG: DUF3857 domain-containing protein [Balneola sp.]|nr:DUF3857 domain-containing protein [Balneola sp.]MBO6651505.1 DUF3857 domain-containing protein [Balneola sp.]MBO6710284.1 DUF3857 domain-containing protein [Balneola sp.]MBO6798969.1 DUF3857 domain-containing protein [Balneola sp.]MBO6870083.1 DUF3857 domain-containing protein [Balneola sp.]